MQLPNESPAAKRVALSALFASLALIFSYVEAILPAAPGIPKSSKIIATGSSAMFIESVAA